MYLFIHFRNLINSFISCCPFSFIFDVVVDIHDGNDNEDDDGGAIQ